eukprot:6472850-Amphidinium_carterae.1
MLLYLLCKCIHLQYTCNNSVLLSRVLEVRIVQGATPQTRSCKNYRRTFWFMDTAIWCPFEPNLNFISKFMAKESFQVPGPIEAWHLRANDREAGSPPLLSL